MSSSSPENVDPTQDRPGPSKSPEERQGPQRTRYGRVIVPKGDLPGEDQRPKNRKKKGKKEEPERPQKRKYTRRQAKEGSNENKDEKEEEDNEERESPDLDPDEYYIHPVPVIKSGQPSALPVPEPVHLQKTYEKEEQCQYCPATVVSFKMEEHLLDNHKEHAQFECYSCRIRSFFTYWDLKTHYRECSNGRIGCMTDPDAILSERSVVEAPYFRRLYQAVECPFCKIYLDTFFDLEVHLNVHGLASMDSKFGCDGCRITFTSIESLKAHLHEKNCRYTSKCFNKGRVLNRREIEKLKERYEPGDRKDCMRKYNDLTYTLSAPKIIEASEEAICAYCEKTTRAYALIKTDLSNLDQYGLQCSPDIEKKMLEKVSKCEIKAAGRVTLCRDHFQWRNWRTKEEEAALSRSKVALQEELRQIVIARKEHEANAVENEDGIAILKDERLIGASFMNDHCYSSNPVVIKLEDDDDGYEVVKNGERREEEEGEGEDERSEGCETIDLSDDEVEDGEGGGKGGAILPLFMNKEELEEKATAGLSTTYECPVCQEMYPNLSDLHNHQEAHPCSRLVYTCADCPEKKYDSPEKINEHFDEKMKSALAAFYSFKVLVHAEVHTDPKETLTK